MMNDLSEERSPVLFDPLQFLGCVALNCLLALFFMGAPFGVLFSHRVLPHPISKVACILGIAISHVIFGLPIGLLIVLMLIGLVTVDSVERGVPVQRVLLNSVFCSLFGAVAVLVVSARMSGESIPHYWSSLADWMSHQILARLDVAPFPLDRLTSMIEIQFPISMVAIVLLSVWLGVGLASHLSWFSDEHPLCSQRLRKTRWSIWIVAGFIATTVGRFLMTSERAALAVAGAEAIFAVLLFCQGCVAVSNILEQRSLSRAARSFWYVVLSTLGFYFSVALGVVWMIAPARARFRRRMDHESNIT
ncbi:MAG: hypothetical protein HYR96_13650 [Deltaproteobacteria bacterium]|nr:hypothetical protein [Deltaproteobacteria bacterium]MBI3293822.1 hypothetical protein [Deltaproteobacteria bacterium]